MTLDLTQAGAVVPGGLNRRTLLATALAGPVSACSPLGAFNIVAGGEGGARQVVSGAAFGSHPRQRLDVYAPLTQGASAPVIFFIYGGSWNSGSRQDYAFVGQALASRGYVVVIADYRLVPEVVFPTFLDDGALALRWVQDNIASSGGDPRRIGLAGHSAGAFNALMLALDQRYLRRAGFGSARIRAVAGLAGPYDFFPFDSPLAIAAMGSWPEPRQTQPINLVRSGIPPVFLATGDADTTVKPRNTQALAARLQGAGNSVTQAVYPGLDHAGILLALSVRLRGRAPVLEEMMRFFDRRLK